MKSQRDLRPSPSRGYRFLWRVPRSNRVGVGRGRARASASVVFPPRTTTRPMKRVLVQFATASDIPLLRRIDPWPNLQTWSRKIEAREVLIALVDDEQAGALRFEFIWTTVPFISHTFVEPRYRRRGVSRALVDALRAHLRSIGHVALLSSSQSDDAPANAWHRALGFARNGVIENVADDGVHENVYRVLL